MRESHDRKDEKITQNPNIEQFEDKRNQTQREMQTF